MLTQIVSRVITPRNCYFFARSCEPWVIGSSLIFFMLGLLFSLWVAPVDAQQGEVYRILFVHAPAAMMSVLIYAVMIVSAGVYWVWNIKVGDMVAAVSAPIGALFTLITLVSGALWGKPTWGTYWIWDARLTSELVLLFIYMGLMAFRSALSVHHKAPRALAMLTVIGGLNLPIIHYSVTWWHTLHQGPTLIQFGRPHIAMSMLVPLLLMLCADVLFYAWMLCWRLRSEIILRERGAQWLMRGY